MSSLWALATQQASEQEQAQQTQGDSSAQSEQQQQQQPASRPTVLFLGQKQAGKTSTLRGVASSATSSQQQQKQQQQKQQQQQQQQRAAKQSQQRGSADAGAGGVVAGSLSERAIALEYAVVSVRDVLTEAWELGGGAALADLVDVVLVPENVADATVVVVVSLEQPYDAFAVAHALLARVHKRCAECVREARERFPEAIKRLQARRAAHAAAQPVTAPGDAQHGQTPIDVPTVIVATHYDVFKSRESEARKVLGHALRYVAHKFGATLLYSSSASESQLQTLAALITGDIDARGSLPAPKLDIGKELVVPFGADSFQAIGLPRTARTGADGAEAWRRACEELFTRTPEQQQSVNVDKLFDSKKFQEARIDTARAVKDEELKRYLAEASRSATLTNILKYRSSSASNM